MKQIEIYQQDIKKVMQILPEGIMIYKRHGNPHIKLWNDELIRLFNFKSLAENADQIKSVDDLN